MAEFNYDKYLSQQLFEAEARVTEQSQRVHEIAMQLTEANYELGLRVQERARCADNLINWQALDEVI